MAHPFALLALSLSLLAAAAGGQEAIAPALKTAVDRYFSTQQEENAEAYLALWSSSARRPLPAMLKYVFDSGDDVFSGIEITRVMPLGERVRVRVSAVRQRTESARPDGRIPLPRTTQMTMSLTYVREGEDWKLVREGPASDDLAHALVESQSAEERAQLLAAEPDLLTDRLLMSIARIAGEAAQQNKHAAAQIGFARMLEAARHIKDRKFEGEALQSLGNAMYFQRNFSGALDAYGQRLAIERERGDDPGAAAALSGIATIRYANAEYAAALAAYREALAIQERIGDEALIATSLISTGNVLYLQGDFDGAIRDYARSRDLNKKIVNPAGEASALEGLGRVYLAKGDIAGALDAFSGVLQEAVARSDRIGQGNATLHIGEAHYRLGNLEVARRTFDDSRAHFEAAKDHANRGRAWQAMALVDLVAGRFRLAEEAYLESRASCASVSDVACVAAATAGLAFAQAAQEKYPPAITNYLRAVDQFTGLEAREQLARTHIGLSHALSGDGEQTSAIAAAAEARMLGIALANDDLVWRALVSEARALRKRGERDAALAAARAALRAVNSLVEQSRTRPASPVPKDTSSVFATVAVLHAEAGDFAATFAAVEQMRVHDLRLGLAPAEREIAKGMTAAEREEERAIAVELVTLHAQLTREKQLPKPDRGRIEQLENTIAAASARRGEQQDRLFERLPDLRTWRALIVPATSSDLAAAMGEGELLLQFAIDEKDLLLLVARKTPEGLELLARVRPVSRRAVAEHVAGMTQPAVLQNAAEWRRAAAKFAEEVFPPDILDKIVDAARVMVAPHEILWRVPFEALPIGERYLGDLTAVTYVPSATAIVRVALDVPAIGEPLSTLAASAPLLSDAVLNRVAQTAPGWTIRKQESAAAEVERVLGALPPELAMSLAGADVTEPALRAMLPKADVIHLALPFRINGAGALFSPLLLAGEPVGNPPEPEQDARLDARDIINMTLNARLVVLSDPAAMSMHDAADETVLVHWAWRAAGVPAVMMPRWKAEPAAGELLAIVHERIRAGDRPDQALHAGRKAVRRTESGAAPYYWAGWLLIAVR